MQLQTENAVAECCQDGYKRSAGSGASFICGHLWQCRESFAGRIREEIGDLQILHGGNSIQGHGIPALFKMRLLAQREEIRKSISSNGRLPAWKVGGD
jgi:hypothetical protein